MCNYGLAKVVQRLGCGTGCFYKRLFVKVLLVFPYVLGFIQYLLGFFDSIRAVFVSVLYVLGFQGFCVIFICFRVREGDNEHRKWKQKERSISAYSVVFEIDSVTLLS